MANKSIFAPSGGRRVPKADTRNAAGGRAYRLSAEHALALYATTGTFNSTYYTSAKDHLQTALNLAAEVQPEVVAKIAVYARECSFMKDMPAFLCAHLASRNDPEANVCLEKCFSRCIDNGKMLRNFAQMVRSGVLGRNSFGSVPKRLMRDWFDRKSAYNIFVNSVGNDPSLTDVVRMVHPKPNTPEKAALFAYLMGAEKEGDQLVVRGRNRKTRENQVFYTHDYEALPEVVRQFEAYKADGNGEVPDIPFQFLTSMDLGKVEWTALAKTMTWNQLRQNLNTLKRHGVLSDPAMVELVANRLADAEAVHKAKVFPYELLVTYLVVSPHMPHEICEALQDALELATENVPALGTAYVAVDTSGSMGLPITGKRPNSPESKMKCVDVAALFAASILRTNKSAEVIPFAGDVRPVQLNPRDSIATNAEKIFRGWGGSTNCSAPLRWLNARRAYGDVVVFVSDYESWVDRNYYGTGMLTEWNKFKSRNPQAKMICIDISPRGNAQVRERKDILQVGGFSDTVFNIMASFVEGGNDSNYWLSEIHKIEL